MKVLIACEFSGTVRDAFRRKGHDAWSCDLLPTEGVFTQYHYQGDVMELLRKHEFDLMIAHPPCTYLANSGVQHLYIGRKPIKDEVGNIININSERWQQMILAANFFNQLLCLPIPKIAVENPIQHRYAKMQIKAEYNQIVQPWQYGHGEQKATCLWLKNLPLLKPTNIVEGREQRIWKMAPTKNPEDRRKQRSITYTGIADAMAKQWGGV